MSTPLLAINNLTVQYSTEAGIVHALEGLSFEVNAGEVLGLVGETGAGKTTAALSIMGLLPSPGASVLAGEVLYKGENLLGKSQQDMRSIRGAEISMIFQDPMTSLNPVISVDRQIAEMVKLHNDVTESEAMERAADMLELVGIRRERATAYPHQFSGGMKQRVVIAIALACNPSLIIADEPTTALDVTIQAQVLDLMAQLRAKLNTSLVIITHDLGIVAEMCDKVAIMYTGRVVEYASTASLFNHPAHPYTRGLFSSVPDIDEDREMLTVIPGLMPDPLELPPGCTFHPRCTWAQPTCATDVPSFVEIAPGHFSACPICAASSASAQRAFS